MPWKERSIVEKRMRFVLRLKDGETMASLCPEFGISRVTGYKIYERYKSAGQKFSRSSTCSPTRNWDGAISLTQATRAKVRCRLWVFRSTYYLRIFKSCC
jgi:hypothetical protein